MARYRDRDWNLPETLGSYDQVNAALLMDIRDELKTLNRLLRCPNFINIPSKLDAIRRNTAKPKRKKPVRK